ncbi:kinesin-like protein Klp98A isoform X1 [Schistocerca gregaria]|uniref:kinesin-like protein Klp98A isoform X1 n=1 Tax=Schistocerca gregaria TaxID=7010 RepID=UPI00211EDFD3|nr:kinesin-like protein Klp98A isoform X1 [Schistocerca gregaria]
MASVKVAVRVRPFNQREIDMDAKLIIQMDGKKTRILNSKIVNGKDGDFGRERYKDFTFDYSYWSFDSSDAHYVSQKKVFEDLGTDVIESAFEGYNACVFAYGQTGSGKTFTMMGSPENQGLIPRICKTLFSRIQAGKEQGTSYRTEVSYLEIYNERVKDLLRKDATHTLRVREHPKLGPYVQDLSRHFVSDYSDIQELMMRGNSQRTTASTNMNDVSSRSHAIFTIMFVQAGFSNNMPSETGSKVHLVDLAGSERADTSGATGQRLKEGAHINKSLVTLGSVISALAEHSSNDSKSTGRNVFIPYRDSVLTWLLKDSLGGNSKTIMIAAVSPADCNYGETLSTLRYANRAKNIINKPTINEDPHVKLIRELRDEITKLRALLGNEYTTESQPQVLAQLHQKEVQEKVLTEEWAEKWRETQKILQEQKALGLRKSGLGVVLDSDMPHLVGIDDNVLSTGVTLYHLKEGETLIGTEDAPTQQDIVLDGVGVEAEHCSVQLKDGVATLIPKHSAQCWVNTVLVDKPTRLSQGCIIVLGRNIMFRYNDPAEAAKLRKEGSRSHLSLSCLSLLSRSTTELAWSTENLSASTEDGERVEELEMQRVTLQKEKEAFKKEQAEREQDWEREQRRKREALEAAQKALEEERQQMEQDYEQQCRKLAEDWQRLEQHQQDDLAVLKQKEAELCRKREALEAERAFSMSQVESEGKIVSALREELIRQRSELETEVIRLLTNCVTDNNLSKDKVLAVAQKLLDQWPDAESSTPNSSSPDSWASLGIDSSEPTLEYVRDLVNTYHQELGTLEAELQKRLQAMSEHHSRVESINNELQEMCSKMQGGSKEFEKMKSCLAQRTQEQLQEIMLRKQSLSLDLKRATVVSPSIPSTEETVLPTLSSSVGTGDTFHTATSPCSEKNDNEYQPVSNNSTSSFEHVSPLTECRASPYHNNKLNKNGINSVSHGIGAVQMMQQLCERMGQQKMLIIRTLEGENCSKSELNQQIAVLQELKRQYVKLEMALEHQTQGDITVSSDESEDLSTSADDGLSENLSASLRIDTHSYQEDSPRRRASQNIHKRILHGRLGSPVSPILYTSNSSQGDADSLSAYSLSIPSPISDGCASWVQIPSYVLRGAGSFTHYEYVIRVCVGEDRWTILRRYKRFRELHQRMSAKYGSKVEALQFPPRRFFSKKSESVARLRRVQLETYLRQLLEVCSTIESCPLFSCVQNPTRLALLEFSSFFRKGVFETGKFGTS